MELVRQAPVLDVSGINPNLDWTNAGYAVQSHRVAPDCYKVIHEIAGAQPLLDLIQQGSAEWVVEARCPATVYSSVFGSAADRETIVRLPPNETIGTVDLWPGIVATKECRLNTEFLSEIWRRESEIDVSKGWWLARHGPLAVGDALGSIIAFRPDDNLAKGDLRIAASVTGGEFRFVIQLHPDQIEHTNDDAFQIMALSTAFAMLPSQPEMEIEGETVPASRIGTDLLGKLRNLGVPSWDQGDQWDPMRAATSLIGLPLPPSD